MEMMTRTIMVMMRIVVKNDDDENVNDNENSSQRDEHASQIRRATRSFPLPETRDDSCFSLQSKMEREKGRHSKEVDDDYDDDDADKQVVVVDEKPAFKTLLPASLPLQSKLSLSLSQSLSRLGFLF